MKIFLPIVLLLLGNVDSQWLRIIVQHDTSIKADRFLKFLHRLEFYITESLELIRFLVLHQTHILHGELAKDLNHVTLHDSLRQIADERQEWRLRGQRLLALIVEPGNGHDISWDVKIKTPRWMLLWCVKPTKNGKRRRNKKN